MRHPEIKRKRPGKCPLCQKEQAGPWNCYGKGTRLAMKQHNPPSRYQVLLRLGVVEAETEREALAKGLELALYNEEGAWHGQPTTTADLVVLPAATKVKP